MNLSYFISRRINQEQREGFASVIHRIAVVSIAVGLAAMIVSFLVMIGFQETVQHKIYGFSGHLTIKRFSRNNSPEEQPMNYMIDVYKHPERYPFIDHVQEFVHKAGLVKTEDEVLGIVVKGVGKSFDVQAFGSNLVEGKFIEFPDSGYSHDIVISRAIADKLGANVGDNLIIHFFQNPPRFRKLIVSGIYETNLSEYFDSRVILGDIRMIQRLNDWSDSLAGGLEIFIKDESKIAQAHAKLDEIVDEDYDKDVESVSDQFMSVFEWLKLVARQVNILLVIILGVICVNMISIVLILVMERTQMIGILKGLGAGDRLIRSIFIYNGVQLILKGLFWGNLLGLGLCFVQYQFRIVPLNPHDYYMSFVPISWQWGIVGILNLLVLGVVTAVLLLPTMIIARINPIKAIRFD